MKKNIRNTILIALMPVFFLLLVTAGCKKASDTADPVQPAGEFWLKGSVINAKTQTGISNAKVYFSGKTILTTDADGNYKVNCKTIGNGSFDIRVIADGYGFGFTSAIIESNAAMVNTIMLNPLSEPVSIGSAGGTVMLPDPEGLTPGSKTTLTIPAGTFSDNINVTLTRFTGIDVPGFTLVNTLNLCTVNLGPAGLVAGRAMELSFPLPFNDLSVDNLPLMRYDFESNTWTNTGTLAQVDHLTNFATVEVTAFGTYSLAIAGTFSESNGSSGAATTVPLNPTLSYMNFSYQDNNIYPDGTPPTISVSYLKNIASQNTRINGIRANFTNPTSFTLNYIGSKPDSLVPTKSTLAGYYRWVPKVTYVTQDMPMTTTIHGVSASGIIQKQVYLPVIGYVYVHDQGGGGK